jgi:quercetin dioxygenase-like cupin family protein
MTTRRDALAAAFALLTEAASAQTEKGADSNAVFVHDLPNLTMDDWQVTVSHVPYPPGRVGQTHHHAGFVLAYVLEGAVVTKISGQPERTYKLLALIFAKKGATLTIPGPASGGH